MPHTFKAQKNSQAVEFQQFFKPVQDAMIDMPKLESQGNRPLQMTFEDHLKALVLRELGNKARRPLVDYLENGVYELRARRIKKQFRVLYSFVGKGKILILTGLIKKSKAVPAKEIRKSKTMRMKYLKQVNGDKNG